jgi:hypothetical protein
LRRSIEVGSIKSIVIKLKFGYIKVNLCDAVLNLSVGG